jgi:hypothetical protein
MAVAHAMRRSLRACRGAAAGDAGWFRPAAAALSGDRDVATAMRLSQKPIMAS